MYTTTTLEKIRSRATVQDGRHWIKWDLLQWLEPYVKSWWEWLGEPRHNPDRDGIGMVTINHHKIVDLIRSATAGIDRSLWDGTIRHVVVGPIQLESVYREMADTAPFSMGINVPMHNNREMRIIVLTIHMIPWFDGILLLPDLDSKAVPY